MNFKISSDFSVAVILTAVYIILNFIFYQSSDIISSKGLREITPNTADYTDSLSSSDTKLSADNKIEPEKNKDIQPSMVLNNQPNDRQDNDFPVLNNDNNNIIDDNQVFNVVEVYPLFPGGEKARMKFLQQNIKYPSQAIKDRKEGKVIVNFIIEKDGTVSNIKVINSVDKDFDEEALRVVRLMPKWIPGKQSGIAVRVNFNMPITFRLNYNANRMPD